MKIKPPTELRGLVGIFAGGCVDRGEGSSFRARAHAHNGTGSQHEGWVCFRSTKRLPPLAPLSDPTWDAEVVGRPNRILMHEYAHILTPNHGHDDRWRATMRALKQPIPKRYQLRSRP